MIEHSSAVYLHIIDTPLGPMTCGATASEVVMLEFDEPARVDRHMRQLRLFEDAAFRWKKSDIHRRVEAELEAYFEGDLTAFTSPIRLSGTPFQTDVWKELRAIPFGDVISYSEQARRMMKPRSVRAVAAANGQNRIAIMIPCHRVIGASGRLTGYGGGLWRKQKLLELEGAAVQLGFEL